MSGAGASVGLLAAKDAVAAKGTIFEDAAADAKVAARDLRDTPEATNAVRDAAIDAHNSAKDTAAAKAGDNSFCGDNKEDYAKDGVVAFGLLQVGGPLDDSEDLVCNGRFMGIRDKVVDEDGLPIAG
jgi:hypothetical protein